MVSQAPDMESLDATWQVRRAIEALPPDEARVVRLQHLEGLTQSEVADQLGIALGTVKSRSHRAHRRLAGLLGHLREGLDG
jgi:RNA polymerase sigma-70 factor (ECF subfamily)